jgi:hypothetical protein
MVSRTKKFAIGMSVHSAASLHGDEVDVPDAVTVEHPHEVVHYGVVTGFAVHLLKA